MPLSSLFLLLSKVGRMEPNPLNDTFFCMVLRGLEKRNDFLPKRLGMKTPTVCLALFFVNRCLECVHPEIQLTSEIVEGSTLAAMN